MHYTSPWLGATIGQDFRRFVPRSGGTDQVLALPGDVVFHGLYVHEYREHRQPPDDFQFAPLGEVVAVLYAPLSRHEYVPGDKAALAPADRVLRAWNRMSASS
jgi:hypothetical protein